MAFSYLDSTSVIDAFKQSTTYMRPLFEPLTEFERIARNQPHPGIDKAYPKVTDGTTSSVIEKTPRRILQQMPTGMAHSPQNDWLTHVSGYILTDLILPNANSQYPFLQKCQAALSKALTYGSQPGYVAFVNRGAYYGTDLILPYIKDVFLEPGKLSDEDSNFIFMRSWYQKRDIEAIIAKSGKLKDGGVDDGWNIANLEKIKDSLSKKDDLATTPAEKDKMNRQGGIEIIHAFQRGKGSTFLSFHVKSQLIVRTKKNPDPRGGIPIHYLYSGIDVSNPLGRGFVEQVGSMQNLMDAEVQMYQYNRALMLNPPMKKRGNWNKNQAKLIPNVLVDLGSDPNADWEPVTIDSSAINNFPANYSLMQSQIYQLLSAPNSNIPATAGNTQTSKTSAGVKQTNAVLGVDDTFIRNQSEAWLEKVYETMLNIYFAEKTGVEELQLSSDVASDIRNLKDCEHLVSEDNKIRLDYTSEAKDLSFRIDPGTSEIEDDTEEIAQLKEIIADVNANPYSMQYVQQAGKELNLGEVYKQLFTKLGLNEIDKILTDVPTGPDGQKQVTPPMAIDKPKLTIHYNDVHSPTIKAALLNNAGIQADPNDIAQSEQQFAQLEAQAKAPAAPDTSGVENHPIIKLMTTLNIKFPDLPEDSKQEVLSIIGIPTNMQSPTAIDQSLSAIQTAHTINDSSQQALHQQAQMAQDSQHKQMDVGLQQQSQQQQAQQNQAQNSLAASAQQQQANQDENNDAEGDDNTDSQSQPQTSQPAPNPQDAEHMQQLLAMGLSRQQAQQALALIDAGYPLEDVLKMIGVPA